MEHFYGSEDIDPETLEDLDIGDDGKVITEDSNRSRIVFISMFEGWL